MRNTNSIIGGMERQFANVQLLTREQDWRLGGSFHPPGTDREYSIFFILRVKSLLRVFMCNLFPRAAYGRCRVKGGISDSVHI